jgi:tRNA (guanine-N7-)-methyltransferase
LSEDTDPRWYGRRHGRKLRAARQRLIDERLPELRISLQAEGETLDPAALFADPAADIRPTDFRMEIGFGTGEHLAALAARHPTSGFIGCEPFVNGVATMLTRIEEECLRNVRIYDDDVRHLLPHLPDAMLTELYILFPDPWPKSRHHRRRITVPGNLHEFARLLADGGRLLFASDQHDFAAWSLAHMLTEPAFEWTARRPGDWRTPPDGWQPTRYQLKAQKRGLEPVFLELRRRPRSSSGKG